MNQGVRNISFSEKYAYIPDEWSLRLAKISNKANRTKY